MKRYGEKTLREALENGAVLSIYDCPARGPILRVKKDDKNLGWITFDLYLKMRLDLEKVKKGEYVNEYTLKSVVYAELRKGLVPETTETETTETTDRTATGRRFYDTEHGICVTDYDLLEEWEDDPGLQQEYPRFSWYLAACQTYQGGTLEEIREGGKKMLIYNLSPIDGKARYCTAKDIKEAAQETLQITHRESGVRCRIAGLIDGYVTAVSESGIILQGWAGEFAVGWQPQK